MEIAATFGQFPANFRFSGALPGSILHAEKIAKAVLLNVLGISFPASLLPS